MGYISFVLFLFLGSCASNSGVVPIGQDIYKIYKRGATGFSGSEAVKSDVMIQASEYCSEQKKSLQVVNVILGKPPYLVGNFPKAEVQFKCVDAEVLEKMKASEKANSEPARQNASAERPDDMYSELKKLKILLDEGIITKEEFTKKKKQILAK